MTEITGSLLANLLKIWESLTGTPNDVLTAFTLDDTPVAGTLIVFRNEVALQGGGVDYTLSGTTVTFILPPATGDRLRAIYIKSATVAVGATPTSNLITLTLGQIVDRCKRACGRDAGAEQDGTYIEWIDQIMGELFGDAKQKWVEAEASFETVAEFKDGTATFTKGSATVTFSSGVTLPSDVASASKKIAMDGTKTGYEIASRTSDTELEMVFKFQEATASGATYKIVQDTYDLASDVESLKIAEQRFTNLHLHLLTSLPVQFKISQRPALARLNIDKTITLYPAPDRVMHVVYEYFALFSVRSADLSLTTQLPDMWVQYLIFGVARNYWLSQGNRIGIALGRQYGDLFREGVIKIRMEKYQDNSELVQFTPYRQPGISSSQTGVDQGTFAQDLLGF